MTRHRLTRRAIMAGVTLLTSAALAACGDGTDGSHGGMPGMPGMSGPTTAAAGSADAAGHNDADVMFAQMMIPHHQQAVAMADLAEGRAADAEIKRLAKQIKAAQDPEIATMNGWLAAWGKPTVGPGDMGGMNHGGGTGMMSDADLAKLKAASGKEFDRQFATMMIAHHQGAVTMAKEELASGASRDAKDLAQKIITAQEAEIDQLEAILARL